jgi:hypothetical protein
MRSRSAGAFLSLPQRIRLHAQFGKFIADETEKWSKVVKFAGIEPM